MTRQIVTSEDKSEFDQNKMNKLFDDEKYPSYSEAKNGMIRIYHPEVGSHSFGAKFEKNAKEFYAGLKAAKDKRKFISDRDKESKERAEKMMQEMREAKD